MLRRHLGNLFEVGLRHLPLTAHDGRLDRYGVPELLYDEVRGVMPSVEEKPFFHQVSIQVKLPNPRIETCSLKLLDEVSVDVHVVGHHFSDDTSRCYVRRLCREDSKVMVQFFIRFDGGEDVHCFALFIVLLENPPLTQRHDRYLLNQPCMSL
ncbi:hypothetical protein D3C71_1263520 [compost metagenome]